MTKTCKLIIQDEVNCRFHGLIRGDVNTIIKRTSKTVKGAFHTAAVRIGAWDGKESQFSDDATTFVFMLDQILPIIEELGYEFELYDNRVPIEEVSTVIDSSYLSEYGVMLRDYQVKSVNLAVKNKQGFVEVATGGGKTYICAVLARIYNEHYRTIIIVPNLNLVRQTKKVLEECGLEVGEIHGKVKNKDKEWAKRHVVTTWQTLNKNTEHLSNFNVLLYDEVHIMGDTMFDVLITELSHAHIRVGFTGTVPSDRQKKEKVCCRIGGGTFHKVSPKELQDQQYLSSVNINIVPVVHDILLPDSDWTTELQYLMNNKKRLITISDYIANINPQNTMILTHSQFGEKLAQVLNLDFIDRRVDPDIRRTFYDKFDTVKYYTLAATFETAGTGISIDNIQRLILIDAGKNDTRVIQGIGRGLRQDGKGDHLEVIDLYSKLQKTNDLGKQIVYNYSGKRHINERKKIYKAEEFPFTILPPITVKD